MLHVQGASPAVALVWEGNDEPGSPGTTSTRPMCRLSAVRLTDRVQ